MSERIDPDADLSETDVDAVAKLFAMVARRVGSVHYVENGNGFQKWILGIVAAVAVIGVAGVVGMYGRLASVETSLTDLKQQVSTLEALIRSHP